VHAGLDAAGLLPGAGAVPDLINAAVYAAEGDYGNAALSAMAAIPGSGDAATVTKYGAKYGDDVLGAVKPFGTGRAPHTADVTVTRDGENVFTGSFTSGNATPEEAALGFPQSSVATHSEARAVRQVPLQAGDQMTINGQYAPCPSCKGAMNKAARTTGANITYTWGDQIWKAKGRQ
jgi:hypothetical protein